MHSPARGPGSQITWGWWREATSGSFSLNKNSRWRWLAPMRCDALANATWNSNYFKLSNLKIEISDSKPFSYLVCVWPENALLQMELIQQHYKYGIKKQQQLPAGWRPWFPLPWCTCFTGISRRTSPASMRSATQRSSAELRSTLHSAHTASGSIAAIFGLLR